MIILKFKDFFKLKSFRQMYNNKNRNLGEDESFNPARFCLQCPLVRDKSTFYMISFAITRLPIYLCFPNDLSRLNDRIGLTISKKA